MCISNCDVTSTTKPEVQNKESCCGQIACCLLLELRLHLDYWSTSDYQSFHPGITSVSESALSTPCALRKKGRPAGRVARCSSCRQGWLLSGRVPFGDLAVAVVPADVTLRSRKGLSTSTTHKQAPNQICTYSFRRCQIPGMGLFLAHPYPP